jgi:hypothetical protein
VILSGNDEIGVRGSWANNEIVGPRQKPEISTLSRSVFINMIFPASYQKLREITIFFAALQPLTRRRSAPNSAANLQHKGATIS